MPKDGHSCCLPLAMAVPALAVQVSGTGMGRDMSMGMGTDMGMSRSTGAPSATSGRAHLPLLPRHRWEQLLLTDVIYAELLSQLYMYVVGIAHASLLVCFQGKRTVQINY